MPRGPARAGSRGPSPTQHPEILEGGRASTATDLYSLGSTLHELLTGRAPFARPTDESWARMALRVIREPAPDLRRLGVPDDVAALVEALMAKRPDQRPARAGDVVERCRAIAAGSGRPQPPAGNSRPRRLPARLRLGPRHRWLRG